MDQTFSAAMSTTEGNIKALISFVKGMVDKVIALASAFIALTEYGSPVATLVFSLVRLKMMELWLELSDLESGNNGVRSPRDAERRDGDPRDGRRDRNPRTGEDGGRNPHGGPEDRDQRDGGNGGRNTPSGGHVSGNSGHLGHNGVSGSEMLISGEVNGHVLKMYELLASSVPEAKILEVNKVTLALREQQLLQREADEEADKQDSVLTGQAEECLELSEL